MEAPEYAQRVFQGFQKNYLKYVGTPDGKTVMEIGPGGSLLSGIFARAVGFERCILIDVGDFASPDYSLYKEWAGLLPEPDKEKFHNALRESNNIFSALSHVGIHYYTGGLESFSVIDDESIDFSFSNAVLEHVKMEEFSDLSKELARVHKSDSISAHQVDYKDHLEGGLNNLRFSSKIWESSLFPNGGFYTNRLRHGKIVEYFETAGFKLIKEELSKWDEIPLARRCMAKEFRDIGREDMSINGAFFVARREN